MLNSTDKYETVLTFFSFQISSLKENHSLLSFRLCRNFQEVEFLVKSTYGDLCSRFQYILNFKKHAELLFW